MVPSCSDRPDRHHVPHDAVLLAVSAVAAAVGALGGLGGAVLLVPVLVLLDVAPSEAAPLGLLTVAAGSLAAAPSQLRAGLVHHRLGLLLETGASSGAVLGALAAGVLPGAVLSRVLAVVALGAGLAGLRRSPLRNPPQVEFVGESAGEWPGTLAGTYRLGEDVVPYQARRVGGGWLVMVLAGGVSGISGVGGGFIKTPVMRELMCVPVKVAAATSTFMVGVTAAAALVVFAVQGRIDLAAGAPIITGALAGGVAGAALQQHLSPTTTRRALGVVLLVVAVAVAVRG
jgi:uncharacterized protein